MPEPSNLSQIEARCREIQSSPYLRKEAPAELQNLRALLSKVDLLIRQDVPSMVAEIKHLRSQIKKLEAEVEASEPAG